MFSFSSAETRGGDEELLTLVITLFPGLDSAEVTVRHVTVPVSATYDILLVKAMDALHLVQKEDGKLVIQPLCLRGFLMITEPMYSLRTRESVLQGPIANVSTRSKLLPAFALN